MSIRTEVISGNESEKKVKAPRGPITSREGPISKAIWMTMKDPMVQLLLYLALEKEGAVDMDLKEINYPVTRMIPTANLLNKLSLLKKFGVIDFSMKAGVLSLDVKILEEVVFPMRENLRKSEVYIREPVEFTMMKKGKRGKGKK